MRIQTAPRRHWLLIVPLIVLLALVLGGARPVFAATLAQDPPPQPGSGNPHTVGDCLGCHALPGMKGQTANGDTVSLTIQPAEHEVNFHTQAGVGCKFCHLEQGEYPHGTSTFATCTVCHMMDGQPVNKQAELIFSMPYADAREFSISFSQGCAQCHQEKVNQVAESAHTRILNEGNKLAPVCVDCHSAHNIANANRQTVSGTCKTCHQQEYNAYKDSVHGSALETEANPDVPTCAGCHGAHAVKGPSNTDFRQIAATEICGKCHSDPVLMEKYGLSTDVTSTYMDDVHGKTNLMGRVNRLDEVKATCYDCHGVHDILPPSNPYSSVYPSNLQATCASCHENATINFPAAWLSHQKPELATMPLLYIVNNYALSGVIIVTLLILLWVILDLRRANAIQLYKNEHPQE
jgi:cytochrome c553